MKKELLCRARQNEAMLPVIGARDAVMCSPISFGVVLVNPDEAVRESKGIFWKVKVPRRDLSPLNGGAARKNEERQATKSYIS